MKIKMNLLIHHHIQINLLIQLIIKDSNNKIINVIIKIIDIKIDQIVKGYTLKSKKYINKRKR